MEQLKSFFKIGDSDKSGALCLDEFKNLPKNEDANQIYRRWVSQERSQGKHKPTEQFLPFNLFRMLDHLHVQCQREKLRNHIESNKFNIDNTQSNIQAFLDLYELDDKAKESNFKESEAKIIDNQVIKEEWN